VENKTANDGAKKHRKETTNDVQGGGALTYGPGRWGIQDGGAMAAWL
jgi:hypothetical protein